MSKIFATRNPVLLNDEFPFIFDKDHWHIDEKKVLNLNKSDIESKLKYKVFGNHNKIKLHIDLYFNFYHTKLGQLLLPAPLKVWE